MNTLANFEQVGKRGFYRPISTVTFERAVDMVAEAMRLARSLGLSDLLVNTTGFMGFHVAEHLRAARARGRNGRRAQVPG